MLHLETDCTSSKFPEIFYDTNKSPTDTVTLNPGWLPLVCVCHYLVAVECRRKLGQTGHNIGLNIRSLTKGCKQTKLT